MYNEVVCKYITQTILISHHQIKSLVFGKNLQLNITTTLEYQFVNNTEQDAKINSCIKVTYLFVFISCMQISIFPNSVIYLESSLSRLQYR